MFAIQVILWTVSTAHHKCLLERHSRHQARPTKSESMFCKIPCWFIYTLKLERHYHVLHFIIHIYLLNYRDNPLKYQMMGTLLQPMAFERLDEVDVALSPWVCSLALSLSPLAKSGCWIPFLFPIVICEFPFNKEPLIISYLDQVWDCLIHVPLPLAHSPSTKEHKRERFFIPTTTSASFPVVV